VFGCPAEEVAAVTNGCDRMPAGMAGAASSTTRLRDLHNAVISSHIFSIAPSCLHRVPILDRNSSMDASMERPPIVEHLDDILHAPV
jgi:hypothetical protein